MSERLPGDMGERFASGLRDVLGLVYVDRDGVVTERVVTVQEVYGRRGDVPGYAWVNWLVGYCHLRQETRQFLVRNIEQIVTPAGEHVREAPQEWLGARFRIGRYDEELRQHVMTTAIAPLDIVVTHGTPTYRMRVTHVEHTAGAVLCAWGPSTRLRKDGSDGAQSDRTLYPDERLVRVVLAETGEAVPDPHAWLAALLPSPAAPVPGSLHERTATIAASGMRTLAALAKPLGTDWQPTAPTAAPAIPRRSPFAEIPSTYRPPPPNRIGFAPIAIGVLIAIAIGAWLLPQHQPAQAPPPAAPPYTPVMPAPPPLDLLPIAYWLAVGAGCLPEQERGQTALRLRTINVIGPPEYRLEVDKLLDDGMRVGLITRSEAVCSRGLDLLDRLAPQIWR